MKRIIYLLSILFLTACHKDSDIFIPDPEAPVVNVTTSIGGTVIDDNNAPVPGAIVQLGTETKETDDNGVFIFRNVEVDSKRAFVKVTKAGYFQGSRAILPNENVITNVRVQLLTNEEIGTIAATTGGEIVLPSGAVIDFPANSVANYSGDIAVSVQYLDPTTNDLGWKMPGDLTGITSDNQTHALISFGMIAIYLEDTDGNELQLAEDKEIEINLPISEGLLAEAPAVPLPLWMFDENSQNWIEKGTATIIGTERYVGKITNGTFWNFAKGLRQVNLSGEITNGDREPLPSIKVAVVTSSGAMVSAGWTDNSGTYSGKVPSDRPLFVRIIDECNNTVVNQTIGLFTAATNTFDLVEIDNDLPLTSFRGSILNCDNNLVGEGYAKFHTAGDHVEIVWIDEEGKYQSNFINCESDAAVELVVINKNNGLESIASDYFGNNIDAGDIVVCNDFVEFITYKVDDDRFLEKDPYAQKSDNEDKTTIGGESSGVVFTLDITGAERGNGFGVSQIEVNNLVSAPSVAPQVKVNFSTYDGVEEYLIGTFSGEFKDSEGFDRELSGTFRIIRDN